MQKYSDVVLDKNGKPVQGADVTVKTYPDGQPATIYGADGGPAVASVKTDAVGRFSFYAANGHYSVTVSGTGISPVDYNDMTLFDPNVLPASGGAALIGHKQAGIGAVQTTLAEIAARRVNLWDYMTAEQRADALSGNPVLEHADAWNRAITALNGGGVVDVPYKGSAAYLLKSPVNLGVSVSTDSRICIDIEPGVLVKATLPNPGDILFNVRNVPGHFNLQAIRNLRAYSTNGNGVAVNFNGQTFGGLENFYIENFAKGLRFSNATAGTFTEFVRMNRGELHLNGTAIEMTQAGGDQYSVHGLSFHDVSMNVGSGQIGLDITNVKWYNATFDFRCFVQAGHTALIRMSCTNDLTGVNGAGFITCEGGPAILTGTGRFEFRGVANFMSGVTDNLSPVSAFTTGFKCDNYIKPQNYGSTAYTVATLRDVNVANAAGNGQYGAMVRLSGSNVEAILANSLGAHATNQGNGFYTGYTGYQGAYSAGALGWFLSSDGTEMKSYAPNGTSISFRHGANSNPYGDNQCFAIKDGQFYIGGAKVCAGSGSPNAVVAGAVGDMYLNRAGGANTVIWMNTVGGNAGWARVYTGKVTVPADSAAADVATLKADFNALLAALRASGV